MTAIKFYVLNTNAINFKKVRIDKRIFSDMKAVMNRQLGEKHLIEKIFDDIMREFEKNNDKELSSKWKS